MGMLGYGVVAHGPGCEPAVEPVEFDDPEPGEVLVRIQASGVCHTDLHATTGALGDRFPYLLGHEGVGVVESIGVGVEGPLVGDTVVLAYRVPCNRCQNCRRGHPARCSAPPEAGPRLRLARSRKTLTRVSRLGTFATHAVVTAGQAIPIPGGIDPASACLIGCGVMTGYGAVAYTGGMKPGWSVAVVGAGGVGVNAIQAAKLLHAEQVIAIDVTEQKLDWARAFGATEVINALGTDPIEAVEDLTGGVGVDLAIDTVGAPQTVLQTLRLCAFGGRSVLLAIPEPTSMLQIPLAELHWRRCDIRSSWYGDCLPARDFPLLANWYLGGQLKLDELVTARIGLSDVPVAFETMRNGTALRSVISIDR